MPLLYVILKYAKGDVEEASRELYEGMTSPTLDDCTLHAFTDLWFTLSIYLIRIQIGHDLFQKNKNKKNINFYVCMLSWNQTKTKQNKKPFDIDTNCIKPQISHTQVKV